MKVGSLTVQEERVRLPDLIQHLDARPQLRDVVNWLELEARVAPELTEVAIHGEHLVKKKRIGCNRRSKYNRANGLAVYVETDSYNG